MSDITNIIDEFNTLLSNEHVLSDDTVVKYLDKICDCLDLKQIYVVTNSIEPNNYLYSYVSSKGEFAGAMHLNLFIVPEECTHEMITLLGSGNAVVVNSDVSLTTKALMVGNLVYGFVDYNHVSSFISFRPNDNHEWTEEEKEIIKDVAGSLRPVIMHIFKKDAIIYNELINSSSQGLFYFYPKLNIAVIPEATREKFTIPNFYYKNALDTFIKGFVKGEDAKKIQDFFSFDLYEKKSITFNSKNFKNRKNTITIMPSRISNNVVEEVIAYFEVIDEKTKKTLSEIERFRELYSRNNLIELSVNLYNEQIKYYKFDEELKFIYKPELKYSDLIKYVSENAIDPANKLYFDRIMNLETLIIKLNSENGCFTFTCDYNIENKKYILETTIISSNRTIYHHNKEVLISVRNVTSIESNNFDKYTGFISLTYFSNSTQEILDKGSQKISFACFQFKDFKNIEYIKGKDEAVKTIYEFAKILKSEFKDTLCARIERDNFICYGLTNTITDKAIRVIDKSNQIFTDLKLDLKCGIYNCKEHDIASEMVKKVSIACDKALESIESIVIYDDKLQSDLIRSNYILDHIDEAIEKQYIKVYYQPVIDTKNENIVGFEALSRWIDPAYGFLSPKDFISVLEENNLLYKLDLYVLEEVCRNLRYQIDRGYNVCPISFNLSRNDFFKIEPLNQTIDLCKKYNIDHSLLNIEITESVTMVNKDLIKMNVSKYQDNGFEVWMDDFGSGYSSLNILKDFDFDEIKIDMEFLRKFDTKSKLIVKSVIDMCKALGVRTLCEGVETKEHLDFLRENGCDRIQGYYYSKPLPYEEVIAELAKREIFIK